MESVPPWRGSRGSLFPEPPSAIAMVPLLMWEPEPLAPCLPLPRKLLWRSFLNIFFVFYEKNNKVG